MGRAAGGGRSVQVGAGGDAVQGGTGEADRFWRRRFGLRDVFDGIRQDEFVSRRWPCHEQLEQ